MYQMLKIPLPSFILTQDHTNTYCQKCYKDQKFDPNNLIKSKNEEFILEKLVINCKMRIKDSGKICVKFS